MLSSHATMRTLRFKSRRARGSVLTLRSAMLRVRLLRLASKFVAASVTYPMTLVKTKAQLEQRRRADSVSSAPEETRAEAEAAAVAEARMGGVLAIARCLYAANGLAAFYAGYGFKMLNTCFKAGVKRLLMANVREMCFSLVLAFVAARSRKRRGLAASMKQQ